MIASGSHQRLPAFFSDLIERIAFMLFLGILLLVLWVVGLVTSYTMGGFIHVLLVLAVIILLSRAIHSGGSRRLAQIRATQPSEIRNPTE